MSDLGQSRKKSSVESRGERRLKLESLGAGKSGVQMEIREWSPPRPIMA
jgi:hypothetical protein